MICEYCKHNFSNISSFNKHFRVAKKCMIIRDGAIPLQRSCTFCYKELSSNYGGWENNEGGYGRFEFNFKNGTVYLFHVQNYEEQESNTLFEVEY